VIDDLLQSIVTGSRSWKNRVTCGAAPSVEEEPAGGGGQAGSTEPSACPQARVEIRRLQLKGAAAWPEAPLVVKRRPAAVPLGQTEAMRRSISERPTWRRARRKWPCGRDGKERAGRGALDASINVGYPAQDSASIWNGLTASGRRPIQEFFSLFHQLPCHGTRTSAACHPCRHTTIEFRSRDGCNRKVPRVPTARAA